MKISEHLARAESFERSIGKLDPLADAELYVVFLMRAATNRVNAALHALGVTDTVASEARVGDLNHTYKPKLECDLPAEVQRMFEPLKFLEDLRPEYVRGPLPFTAALADECRRAHAAVVERTSAAIERRREAA